MELDDILKYYWREIHQTKSYNATFDFDQKDRIPDSSAWLNRMFKNRCNIEAVPGDFYINMTNF